MSCNCPDINVCPTEPNCVCGVTLSFYDGCDLTCQLSSGGYIGTYGFYYDFVSQDPSCQSYKLDYNNGLNRWELYYEDPNPIIVAALPGPIGCPIAGVDDWVYLDPSNNQSIKSEVIDCGCCDESLEITLYVDGIGIIESTAYVQYDEYGMPIFYNGKLYYEFTFSITDGEDTRVYNYFLYYTGNFWAASLELGGFGDAIMELSPDCPYGYYLSSMDAIFQTFWVRGSKCFDCCDYYTPKNRNLLKKKKAIFVDEISAIRNQEIFGLKCGGSWEDLFRKHLIFDVLNCLPYGVLCEEEEQCLINNLNENCNC